MRSSILRVLAFAVVCLVLAATSFGQSDVATELGKTFSRFDVAKLDQKARLLSIAAEGRVYSIALEPHDIRASNYRAEDTGLAGLRSVTRGEINTFIGVVDDQRTSRINLTAKGFEGYFETPAGRFFFEPAGTYSRSADPDSYVIYRAENTPTLSEFSCGLASRIESGAKLVAANRTTAANRVEIATEADLEYVQTLGGAAQANAEILGILNTVEGLYSSELNMTVRVTYQHTWSTADPFAASSTQGAVLNFQNYWNANVSYTQYPRDTAHLFSGKSNFLSQGWAWINVVCNHPESAYGMSGYISWAPGKYLITAHEIGHNLGANHSDTAPSCGNTLMNAQLSGNTALSFCQYSRDEVAGHVATAGGCLTGASACRFDFDGDSKADISVFRPSSGSWFVARSSAGFIGVGFGQNGDKTVAADYDGDGKTDMAVYRGGIWFRLFSSTNTFDGVGFGNSTDKPVPADFDGDGKADLVVYRASQGVWYQTLSATGAFNAYPFGIAEDVPLPGDYDGDGKADINVFRPSTGAWYRIRSATNSFYGLGFGTAGDKPVVGDFDGDGKSDTAVFRPSVGTWFVLRSDNSFYGTGFGSSGDVPVPADYDGDGKADLAVYRQSQGVWYRLDSSTGGFVAYPFGLSTDQAVPALVP